MLSNQGNKFLENSQLRRPVSVELYRFRVFGI
jgi:hypothetical protein